MSLGGLVMSNGDQIYKHAIKWVVVGLIPLKFHSKCFWKKGNLVKIKKNSHKWYISSYLCLKNDLPGRWKAMFELRLKMNVDINPRESDLVVQLPSPLEFPGPLTPHPPGISLSLCGGGLDIFWNHTLKFSLLTDQDTVCSKGTCLPTCSTYCKIYLQNYYGNHVNMWVTYTSSNKDQKGFFGSPSSLLLSFFV